MASTRAGYSSATHAKSIAMEEALAHLDEEVSALNEKRDRLYAEMKCRQGYEQELMEKEEWERLRTLYTTSSLESDFYVMATDRLPQGRSGYVRWLVGAGIKKGDQIELLSVWEMTEHRGTYARLAYLTKGFMEHGAFPPWEVEATVQRHFGATKR